MPNQSKILLAQDIKSFNFQLKNLLSVVNNKLENVLGLKFLTYRKFFNSKLLYIFNNDRWLEHSLNNNIFHSDTFSQRMALLKNKFQLTYVWPTKTTDTVYNQLFDFNICHGFIIYRKLPNYYESFAFYTDKNIDIANLYLREQEQLNTFMHYFHERTHSLIEKADKNIYFDCDINSIIEKEPHNKIDNFFPVKKYYLQINNDEVGLTTREIECIYYLSNNLSYKTIAKHLKLSPRTIEFYMNNIKQKTKTYNNEAIIEAFNNTFGNLVL